MLFWIAIWISLS